MKVLLLNAGSSSLKASLMDANSGTVVAHGSADLAGGRTRYQYTGPTGIPFAEEPSWRRHGDAVKRFVSDLTSALPAAIEDARELAGVGHRIVHGGDFTRSVQVTPAIQTQIASLAQLAPLHNPPSLETLAAAQAALPRIPHIAVFDTAFHSTLSNAAYTFPLPDRWTNGLGIRRYGFHGLSHAYCAQRAGELLKTNAEQSRLVICHLGHGCSASAVQAGRCVDTTMGFTPLDGLMMATRCGSLDPSILLHLQQAHGIHVNELHHALHHESGLLGVSGVSADMREVLAAAHHGHQRAQLALDIYTRRIRQAIGALTVTMGGIDALVFTAGVGEHSPEIRSRVCQGLECLGLELDSSANDSCGADVDIAKASSHARILVIATREDLTMLREVQQALVADPSYHLSRLDT